MCAGAQGQEYTIVRPGRLVDGPLGRARICVGQNNASFMSGASSTRADVAACCVAAMSAQAHGAVNTTFEMACEPPVCPSLAPLPCFSNSTACVAPNKVCFGTLNGAWA